MSSFNRLGGPSGPGGAPRGGEQPVSNAPEAEAREVLRLTGHVARLFGGNRDEARKLVARVGFDQAVGTVRSRIGNRGLNVEVVFRNFIDPHHEGIAGEGTVNDPRQQPDRESYEPVRGAERKRERQLSTPAVSKRSRVDSGRIESPPDMETSELSALAGVFGPPAPSGALQRAFTLLGVDQQAAARLDREQVLAQVRQVFTPETEEYKALSQFFEQNSLREGQRATAPEGSRGPDSSDEEASNDLAPSIRYRPHKLYRGESMPESAMYAITADRPMVSSSGFRNDECVAAALATACRVPSRTDLNGHLNASAHSDNEIRRFLGDNGLISMNRGEVNAALRARESVWARRPTDDRQAYHAYCLLGIEPKSNRWLAWDPDHENGGLKIVEPNGFEMFHTRARGRESRS